MKPRIVYSIWLRAWVCYGRGIHAVGSSGRVAYKFWLDRAAERFGVQL